MRKKSSSSRNDATWALGHHSQKLLNRDTRINHAVKLSQNLADWVGPQVETCNYQFQEADETSTPSLTFRGNLTLVG